MPSDPVYTRLMSKDTMTITPEQIDSLLQAYCHRQLDNMDYDDLYAYAMQLMAQSFDKNPGQGDTDVNALVADILLAENEDEDAAFEFIAGAVDNELADELMGPVG